MKIKIAKTNAKSPETNLPTITNGRYVPSKANVKAKCPAKVNDAETAKAELSTAPMTLF